MSESQEKAAGAAAKKRHPLGKIFNVVLHPAVRLIVESVVFISLIILVYLGTAKSLPFLKDQQFFVVMSGSMEPKVPTGSLILVRRTPEQPKVGDVITFLTPRTKQFTTHRVLNVKVEEQSKKVIFSTKGDANTDPDPWILTQEDVIGKMQFVVPLAGYIVHYAKTPQGFFVLAVIPGIIFIADEIWKMKKLMQLEYEKKILKLKAELAEAKETKGHHLP
jgi:signal peptidase